jgi:hypothetical protein
MRLSLRSAVQNNQVGGNVQVDHNSGSSATVVSNNTIGGNLQCAGNSPGVTDNGSKNNVTGLYPWESPGHLWQHRPADH